MGPVEVITSVERRRHWSAAQKQAMVEEAEEPGNTISSVARKYGVHPNQLFKWRKLVHQGALVAVGNEEPRRPRIGGKALKGPGPGTTETPRRETLQVNKDGSILRDHSGSFSGRQTSPGFRPPPE